MASFCETLLLNEFDPIGMSDVLRLSSRAKIIIFAVAVGFALLRLVDWAAQYFWFEALGYESVFWTIRELKVELFVSAFVLAYLYFWINLRVLGRRLDLRSAAVSLASTLRGRSGWSSLTSNPEQADDENPETKEQNLVVFGIIAVALVFGGVFYSQWDTVIRFWWSTAYGKVDPVFNEDIGFFLFTVPFLELLQNTLLAASVLASVLLIVGYRYAESLQIGWRTGIVAPSAVQWHITANLVLFLFALAWGYYLDRYSLLQSTRGAVYGAGYTDLHVTLPAKWIMIVATLGLAVMLLVAQFRNIGKYLFPTVAGFLAVQFLCLILIPWGVQSYRVEPNELELETPFLQRNIALTREAYQLDHVVDRTYSALGDLTPTSLTRNRETIDNIRVWDWRPLSETFRQLQQIRAYYEFGDVDVDRYWIDGAYRQVMLGVRELSRKLPGKADTWVNRHLQYTHGYGLAMSLTATKTKEGGPEFIVKDLPPRAKGGLSVTEPAVYYGENMPGYRIVATSVPEFSYPKGDRNVYSSYNGSGGVPIGPFWMRLLYAWHQFDADILITSYITPHSRIQFWRNVQERIQRLAPFLRLDKDPYPVLSGGRLYWLQDAYTVASNFPYAEPTDNDFNYIRNSVKVVVDSYNGDVTFYVIDPDDPVVGVYRKAFPVLFRNIKEMSDDLRRHLRYPQDLFEVQVAKYSTYHMKVPQVFYNNEDQWNLPREKYSGKVINMDPYYVLVRLPEEKTRQFFLMTPVTPANRSNMIAWMAARCDYPGYGQLLVYKLPKERLILGPMQIEATIDQDTIISQQLSLWDQRGSRVIRGNLLVIPIDRSFLYVEPVYLIAEDSEIPQLKRVIVSDGKRLAMEPTLLEALNVVFGLSAEPKAQAATGKGSKVLSEARDALAKAENALRDGDWDLFGQAMRRLQDLLKK